MIVNSTLMSPTCSKFVQSNKPLLLMASPLLGVLETRNFITGRFASKRRRLGKILSPVECYVLGWVFDLYDPLITELATQVWPTAFGHSTRRVIGWD